MNDRQDTDREDGPQTVLPAPAAEGREPVTHSLKGSITIDLNKLKREEERNG